MPTGDPICPQCGVMGPHWCRNRRTSRFVHRPHGPVVVLKPGEPVRGFAEIKAPVKEEDLKNGIETVVNRIVSSYDQEIRGLTEEELRTRWYFTYDPLISKEYNIYEFFKMLEMHRKECRKWEEMHHGYMCVVERVRDKYLMPKIREFLANQETHHG